MYSINRVLNYLIPFFLVGFFVTYSIYIFISSKQITSYYENLTQKLLTESIQLLVKDPLYQNDHLEIAQRLQSIKEKGFVENICVMSDNFNMLPCKQNQNSDNIVIEIISPNIESQKDFYVLITPINSNNYKLISYILFGLFAICALFIAMGKLLTSKIYDRFLIDIDSIIAIIDKNQYNDVQINELSSFQKKILEFAKKYTETKKKEELFNLAHKIAHDIRSPISTLNLISSKITDPEIQSLQNAVANQINEITNNLLTQIKNDNLFNVASLWSLLNSIEKEFEIKIIKNRKLLFLYDSIDIDYTLNKSISTVIYSCINNFIQNSIEATADDGVIEVIVKKSDVNGKSYEIIVKDNGKGIPDHILSRLGTEAISYGKEANNSFNSGNGIALFNAKKDLNQIGAELKIQSQINIGTEITICI